MKTRGFVLALILAMIFSVNVKAEEFEISTYEETDLTYYKARLTGCVSGNTENISSYGFELWASDLYNQNIQAGTSDCGGEFSSSVFLCADTTYFYRAYAKDIYSNYHYGETKSFKTPESTMNTTPEVNLNITVQSPEEIDFSQYPNKFLLNNLIVNNPDTLKLIAGNNFDGIEGIMPTGGENIFINQYFINKYNTDPVLKSLLTVFDGAVYNREEFLWDTATSLLVPDFVAEGIYNISPDNMKSTLNTIYGDMGVKRFNGAINNVLSSDYTSSDRKTFGYEKTNYKLINAFSSSIKNTRNMINNYQNGKEELIDDIEKYQEYYFNTVMPKYSNTQNDFLKMNQYLMANAKNMTDEEIAENLDCLSQYSQKISAYENMDFAYETASKWKTDIETNYFAQEVSSALEKLGKPLSLASSSLGTLKTVNQVYNNKGQLQGTFERLADTTDNKKLRATLEDYIYKMNNCFGGFLSDTASNIYSIYFQSTVKKDINSEIINSAKKLVAGENNLYTEMVIDKALAKANYVLIAADAGGMFSEKISGTKTHLEKAIEAKYLWNIENESKKLLQIDLSVYGENPTEENAEAVLNDLFWIKALKLRELTVTKELYNANGGSWVALADKSLSQISDAVDEMFVSQRDALINASLTETKYTSQPLTLEADETYTLMNHNSETGYNGALKTPSGTTMLKNADSRLSGGINIKKGATLNISASDATVYIPFISMESGANLVITGGNVKIGEFYQNGGTVVIAGNSVADITGDVSFNNKTAFEEASVNISGNVEIAGYASVSLGKGKLTVGKNLYLSPASRETLYGIFVQEGELNVKGNVYASNGAFDCGRGKIHIGGSFLSGENSISGLTFYMREKDAYMLIEKDFFIYSQCGSSEGQNISAGTMEVKGNFTCKSTVSVGVAYGVFSFAASGTHKVILSGENEQTIDFTENVFKYNGISILKSTNPRVNFSAHTKVNRIENNSVFNNLKLISGSFEENANGEISGNLSVTGKILLNGSALNVGGDFNISDYASVSLGKGKLTVGKNLYLSPASRETVYGIFVQEGELNVKGNVYASNGAFDCGSGKIHIGGSFISGENSIAGLTFYMREKDAYMLIEKDFFIHSQCSYSDGKNISAGTMELKGNFTCKTTVSVGVAYGVYGFAASGTHKVILSGENEQNITFTDRIFKSSRFNILINKNPDAVFDTNYLNFLFNEVPHIVTFVTNTDKGNVTKILDSSANNTVSEQLLNLGTLKKKDNYFKGWYTDSAFTEKWDESNDLITSDITLYAKWSEPIKVSTPVYSNNSISVKAVLDDELINQNGTVIAALYNKGKLVLMHTFNSDETISYTFGNIPESNSNYTIEILCWSDFKTLTPLCDGVYKTVELN